MFEPTGERLEEAHNYHTLMTLAENIQNHWRKLTIHDSVAGVTLRDSTESTVIGLSIRKSGLMFKLISNVNIREKLNLIQGETCKAVSIDDDDDYDFIIEYQTQSKILNENSLRNISIMLNLSELKPKPIMRPISIMRK